MKFSPAILATFFAFVTSSIASRLEKRDVFVPPVLSPNSGTVWIIGQHHNVTWDASNAPAVISNRASCSLVKNRRLLTTGPGSLASPMAQGFDLREGRVEVQVPNVPSGSDYQIVLFGDSGNWGPVFTITN